MIMIVVTRIRIATLMMTTVMIVMLTLIEGIERRRMKIMIEVKIKKPCLMTF